jgi:hypothetical protein
MKTAITGYWTFFCNPAKWEIDKFLSTNIQDDGYQVTDWQKDYFQTGQLGIIRVGIDQRNKKQRGKYPMLHPGIYAIVEILSKAIKRDGEPDKYWINWTPKELEKPFVRIRYLYNLLNSPLLLSDIKNDNVIQMDSYLCKGFQASSMPLRKIVFERIVEIIGNENNIFDNAEIEPSSNLTEIKMLEEKYRNATPQVKEVISKRIERGKLANKMKKITQYKCLVCEVLGNNTHTFKKNNGEYYIEAHHIIPVSEQKQGTLCTSNIITVCPNHHRQLHYGRVKLDVTDEKYFLYIIDDIKVKINKIIL